VAEIHVPELVVEKAGRYRLDEYELVDPLKMEFWTFRNVNFSLFDFLYNYAMGRYGSRIFLVTK
jgi:hypothetical protein